ncbi:cytochrome b6 [Tanacetum coccineum]
MTFYYRPTVTDAFASVQYIMTEANFGWLIRSVHRWSASMMVLMMILHVFRVYLTGGFKKPRELTWVTGVVLGVLTASFGVTGYSLPRDQIGYWAVKIVTGVPNAIPVIGAPLVELLRGSASVGQSTLTRFYSLHTSVLPLLTAVFMLMHFPMIRKQDGENLDKTKEKRDSCILVGYSTQSKGYRVYNKRICLIVESIHLRFDEIEEMSETSVANNTLGLILQRQKVSDYDNSGLAPQLQNVSPSADTTAPSQQELDLLFGPLKRIPYKFLFDLYAGSR